MSLRFVAKEAKAVKLPFSLFCSYWSLASSLSLMPPFIVESPMIA